MAKRKAKATTAEGPELDSLKEDFADLSITQRAALSAFLEHNGNISEACRAASISRARWYQWKESDEKFQQALEAVDEYFTDQLETAARNFAFQGDTTLIIFLLKSRRRWKYDDAYARQERAFEKGVQQTQDGTLVPIRAILVRDDPPPGVQAVNGEVKEREH